MKITKKMLKEMKACSSSYQKFINTFDDGVIIPDNVTTIKVKDFDLFDDIRWLMAKTNIGLNKIVYNGLSFIYKYDSNGNCVEGMFPGNNNYQTYKYDENNNVTEEISPSGYKTTYKYDENNNKIETIYPNGNKITFKYDEKYENSELIFS